MAGDGGHTGQSGAGLGTIFGGEDNTSPPVAVPSDHDAEVTSQVERQIAAAAEAYG